MITMDVPTSGSEERSRGQGFGAKQLQLKTDPIWARRMSGADVPRRPGPVHRLIFTITGPGWWPSRVDPHIKPTTKCPNFGNGEVRHFDCFSYFGPVSFPKPKLSFP
jgi:hypothetical protein